MAIMSHTACQQHREGREPFNLLIPSGIDDTVMPLDTNMSEMAGLKCTNLILRMIGGFEGGIDFHLYILFLLIFTNYSGYGRNVTY